ncbi:hypothetical protein [Yinghuangia seranimata]|uniref:hypothetical protein n=1 Tax=Yinghuangia seranimata TaxID=408067 RepID=UPI00248C64DD|nr:hypothetical protein [Yinghuangia seranimata]MDI2128752.1 hypothetical protein [Yinghuangia seranimata]
MRNHAIDGIGDRAALMDRKADLFERIAASEPGNAEYADVARGARLQADEANGRLP